MSGFTLGPWFERGGRVYAGRPDKIGPLVASLGIRRDPVEEDANARLIAAAPDMLAALKQALLYIEADEDTHGRKFGDGNVVRAAIAKAMGEAQ